jgi:hypothetical protein
VQRNNIIQGSKTVSTKDKTAEYLAAMKKLSHFWPRDSSEVLVPERKVL